MGKFPKIIIAVIAAAALGAIITLVVKNTKKSSVKPKYQVFGCFEFKDGTVQNWKLGQLYDTNSSPYTKVKAAKTTPPYTDYTPFALANHQNIGLEASTNLYLVPDSKVKSCDIYFESPDLTKNKDWQNIKGFELDLRREFFSPCGDNPSSFTAQLQMKVIDSANKEHHKGEYDPSTGKFIFHTIKLNTPYHFKWEPPFLTEESYTVKQVRIRCTMPGYISTGECFYRGKWKIGNVCPIK